MGFSSRAVQPTFCFLSVDCLLCLRAPFRLLSPVAYIHYYCLCCCRVAAMMGATILQDDDDDDLSDEEERGGITGVDDGDTDADVVISKARRRATLNVGETPSRLPDGNDGVGHSRSLSRMLSSRANGSGGLGGEALEPRSLSARFSKRMLTIEANDSHLSKMGFRSWRIWSVLTRCVSCTAVMYLIVYVCTTAPSICMRCSADWDGSPT